MPTFDDLPKPSIDAKKRSDLLTAFLHQEIAKQPDRLLTFASYMNHVLYHPNYGYYCAPEMALGKHGDFTTAPEISSLFGQCLARQIAEVMAACSLKDIYELGAGSGKLAYDILQGLNQLNCLPEHYFIFEISASLRCKQKDFLQTHCPQWLNRIVWIDAIPDACQGIVIANEVLDALPVNLFAVTDNGVTERCVTVSENQFSWSESKDQSSQMMSEANAICHQYELYPGYHFEINFSVTAFLQSTLGKLTKGVVLLIDYGYGQAEYYHPQRKQGTLTCFYQHHRHDDPFWLPGLQDITSHVDFTRVIETADSLGYDLAGFTSQAAFLLACGLMELAALLESEASEEAKLALHHAIKLLTLPTEMGERVKVMALTKGCELELVGFTLHDRRRDL